MQLAALEDITDRFGSSVLRRCYFCNVLVRNADGWNVEALQSGIHGEVCCDVCWNLNDETTVMY